MKIKILLSVAIAMLVMTGAVSCGDDKDDDIIPKVINYSALAVEPLPTMNNDEALYGYNRKADNLTTEFTEEELAGKLTNRFWNMSLNFSQENFVHDGTLYCNWLGSVPSSDQSLEYIYFNPDWRDYAWPASVHTQLVDIYKNSAFYQVKVQGRTVTLATAEGCNYDALWVKHQVPFNRNQSFEVVGYNDYGMVVEFAPTDGDLKMIAEINRKKPDGRKLDTARARIRCFFPCITRDQYVAAVTGTGY